jgi:transposase InsO family protein
MDESASGNRYILTVVDEFTRYVWTSASEQKDAVTVARRLLEIACMFGFPAAIKSDQGGEFDNRVVMALSKAAKVDHQLVVPYNHHANGLVERANRTVKDTVLKLCREATGKTDRWDDYIHMAMLAVNGKVHAANKSVPFGLMLGRGPFSAGAVGADPIRDSNVGNWAGFWKTFREGVVPHIHKIQGDEFQRRVPTYRKKTSTFKPGDIVMHRLVNGKTGRRAVGPFRVKKQVTSRDYLLEAKTSTFLAPANFLHRAQLQEGEELGEQDFEGEDEAASASDTEDSSSESDEEDAGCELEDQWDSAASSRAGLRPRNRQAWRRYNTSFNKRG